MEQSAIVFPFKFRGGEHITIAADAALRDAD